MTSSLPFAIAMLVVGSAASFVAAANGAVSQVPPTSTRLTWTPATIETTEGDRVRVAGERGRLVVDERWGEPAGRTIVLQLVRLRATTSAPGPPTVYLAGGPGGSGIASLTGDRFPLFQALRSVGDVIAIDQRGVRSEPFPVCREPFRLPFDRPAQLDAWLPVYRDMSARCAARWREAGIDIAAYNTTESAGDLAALGRELGTSLNLLGISYGTHLALETLRRYPALVHRAVLAGVEGPDDTLKLPGRLDAHLRRVAAVIAADPVASTVVPDLIGSFTKLLGRLAPGVSVTVPGPGGQATVTVGPADLQMATFEMTSRRSALEQFPLRLSRLVGGDLRPLGQWAVSRRQQPGIQVLSMVADCTSGASPARLARIARESPASLMADSVNWPFMGVCEAWGADDAGDEYRTPVRSSVPTLFISGSIDGRTPEENAIDAASGFLNASMLRLDPAGHDDDLLIAVPEIGQAIVAFLQGRAGTSQRLSLPPLRFAR